MNLPDWIPDPNNNRINFHEPFEIHYWMEEWGITEQRLREAKERAGSSIVIEIYRQLLISGSLKPRQTVKSA